MNHYVSEMTPTRARLFIIGLVLFTVLGLYVSSDELNTLERVHHVSVSREDSL